MYSSATRYQYRAQAIKRGKKVALYSRICSTLVSIKYELGISVLLVGFTIAYFS